MVWFAGKQESLRHSPNLCFMLKVRSGRERAVGKIISLKFVNWFCRRYEYWFVEIGLKITYNTPTKGFLISLWNLRLFRLGKRKKGKDSAKGLFIIHFQERSLTWEL